ncbi:MAG: putative DNA binding domain-containing protein [Paludibacteraceae bacterium]|nr:putative DNA binding domain-containing protein [Paludibacteraceae bacterium]
MNQTEIQDLLQKGERISLECKKASTNVPESLWESYSAFANTYGGTILLGVKEDLAEKGRHTIEKRY